MMTPKAAASCERERRPRPATDGFGRAAGQHEATARCALGTTAVPLSSSALEPASASSHVRVSKAKAKRPVTATPTPAATKVVGASGTQSSGERTLEEFKAAVKEGQIRYLQAKKGRHQFDDVPDAELAVIEGKHRMRKVPAQACKDLLAAARAALVEGKALWVLDLRNVGPDSVDPVLIASHLPTFDKLHVYADAGAFEDSSQVGEDSSELWLQWTDQPSIRTGGEEPGRIDELDGRAWLDLCRGLRGHATPVRAHDDESACLQLF
jgi:hypothetical protein